MKRYLLLTTLFLTMILTANAQITSVGIIGSATPGGWDNDTDMAQDATNPDLWTINITLIDGAAKFRTNDDWAVNWGSADFPRGVGEQDGADIPVFAGEYFVSLNTATGEYDFQVMSPIGIIGDATPGGWDNDTDMYNDSSDSTKFFIELSLNAGEAKFRKDDDWAVNWGSDEFPMGIGTQDGPNIPVSKAGDYRITLDTVTGAYNFEELITFASVGLTGDATGGMTMYMTQDANNANLWRGNLELGDGEAHFIGNDDMALQWGSMDFPTGTAELGGPAIPRTAGNWSVTFNTEDLTYEFLEILNFASVGIIGDATPGGWDTDTDMNVDAMDASQWNLRIVLADGEAKFRADDDWVFNWGAGDFPMGVALLDGANIPITAGEYIIDFNTTTGDYLFTEIIVFDTVGIIGTGTTIANWDDDVFLDKDPDNEFHFSSVVALTQDGEIKFRANADWTVNWGAVDFPAGVGTQDGDNIIITTGGNYLASIYTDTGAYSFSDPSSVEE
ncbi:MAG: SusF/SusE family outer membrane protein, partial [Saprospiraceae bacterium]|nr:SusF/SusE family outer membrane protein [Saprospiraceae bacterium]